MFKLLKFTCLSVHNLRVKRNGQQMAIFNMSARFSSYFHSSQTLGLLFSMKLQNAHGMFHILLTNLQTCMDKKQCLPKSELENKLA
jgi:hypothetical protein